MNASLQDVILRYSIYFNLKPTLKKSLQINCIRYKMTCTCEGKMKCNIKWWRVTAWFIFAVYIVCCSFNRMFWCNFNIDQLCIFTMNSFYPWKTSRCPNHLSLASLLKYFSPWRFFSLSSTRILLSATSKFFKNAPFLGDFLKFSHRRFAERTFYANPINFIFHIAGIFWCFIFDFYFMKICLLFWHILFVVLPNVPRNDLYYLNVRFFVVLRFSRSPSKIPVVSSARSTQRRLARLSVMRTSRFHPCLSEWAPLSTGECVT